MKATASKSFSPVLLLTLCALTAACSPLLQSSQTVTAPGIVLSSMSPTTLPTITPLALPTSSPPVMPTRLMAALSGRLVRVDGCFRVDTEQGSLLIGWTPVFEVHLEQEAIEIRDTLTGEKALWRVGDWIEVGGGAPSQMDPEFRQGQPMDCPGPYFVMHAFARAAATSTPSPSPTLTLPPGVASNPYGQVSATQSPDKHWTALLDTRVGSLELQRADGTTSTVFAPGSTADSVTWSPDSQNLLVVKANYYPSPSSAGYVVLGPIEIWRVRPEQNGKPIRLFQSPTDPAANPGGADHIDFGQWTPNSRSVVFWLGSTSGSFQANGAALYALDVEDGKSTRLAETALLNPLYQSWAPDSMGLVFTSGGYRSAQVNKWLSLYDAKTGKVTAVVDQKEAVPGIVAWSPRGDLIAYAAVNASDTGEQWADYFAFDNPAILNRRVYLLDPKAGKHWRLNNVDAFQDAPAWSADGSVLYYVQREGDDMVLMAANPTTGQGQVIEKSRRPAPSGVGYYGQSNWDDLLAFRPDVPAVPMPTLTQTFTASSDGYSIQYPAGWNVGRGWSYLIYGCSECITITPAAETNIPDYGPFSGRLFLSIENRMKTGNDMEKLLNSLLGSAGLGQIVNRGALLKTFDRHAMTVDGQPAVRLETLGEFGEVNHMLVVANDGRVIVLRGRGDGRVFDAMAASLHLP